MYNNKLNHRLKRILVIYSVLFIQFFCVSCEKFEGEMYEFGIGTEDGSTGDR